MDPLRLLRSGDLKGTAYFEFCPYGDQPPESSVFLSIDAFDHIEPVSRRHVPDFDYTGISVISRAQWPEILADLEKLRNSLQGGNSVYGQELSEMIADVSQWLNEQPETTEKICINGF